MKVKPAATLMALLLLFVAATRAGAHHSFSVEFDGTKCLDLAGSLTGIEWENPHAWLRMEVKDASGRAVTWRLEMITPNALNRNGSPRQVFVENTGKPMNARACPAREGAFKADGANRGAAEYIKLADGIIRIVGQVVERNMTPEKLSFY
jgi:hypothetical protein